MALPLLLCVGLGVDYTMMRNIRGTLQESVDAAALVGAKELAVAGTTKLTARGVAETYARGLLSQELVSESGGETFEVDTDAARDKREITVSASLYWEPMLLHLFHPDAMPLKASATATLTGEESICVIALDSSADNALALTGTSNMSANGCSIYSNSNSSKSISLAKGATLNSLTSYTSGGYFGSLEGYSPRPVTDSPRIADPLKSRSQPAAGPCREKNFWIDTGSITLHPGTYCGGIHIEGSAKVSLEAGIYVVKDGPLWIGGNATLSGEYVGFSFTGEAAVFDFGVSTQVDLLAPRNGPMAGILFFEDRSSSLNRLFSIRSKDAERFEGTIYIPRARLFIDKESRLGQMSNWTAIIANQIEVGKGPNVQINSDYAKSKIPVPDGVGPSAHAHLMK
ncbi:MAG: Tad domain-containing protein [Nitratireductor sp.]|nr:Tad domain-containing protein [Nitratireductor sp.]